VNRRRRRELPVPAPAFNIGPAFGLLQEIIAHVDAMAYATQQHFERFGWHCRDEVDDTETPLATSRTSSALRGMRRFRPCRRPG